MSAIQQRIPEDIANEGLERLPDDMYEILQGFSETFDLDI